MQEQTHYLLPPLNTAQMEKLVESGVAHTVFDASANSILIAPEELTKVLELFDKQTKETFVTGYDGILGMSWIDKQQAAQPQPKTAASMVVAKRAYDVRVEGGCDVATQIVAIMRDEVAPILDKDIYLYSKETWREDQPNPDPDRFNIFYGVAPFNVSSLVINNRIDKEAERTLWGVELPKTAPRLNPPMVLKNMFFPIVARDNPNILLALFTPDKNTLYMAVSVMYATTSAGIASRNAIIFKHILAEAIKIIGQRDLTLTEQQYYNTDWIGNETIVRSLLACDAGQVDRIRNEITQIRDNVTNLQAQLGESIRMHGIKNEQLQHLIQRDTNIGDTLMKQVEELRRMPIITGLDITKNNDGHYIFTITTAMLHCVDPRSKVEHEIGRFMINLNFTRSHVRWFNMDHVMTTPAGNNMQAPHIFNDGHACLGSWSETVSEMMAQGNLAIAVTGAIAIVESVNVADSAGQYISSWPISQRWMDANPDHAKNPQRKRKAA